jgi:hypothetical protein
MALTKPRRTHETSGAMDSRSMTGPFFEVPTNVFLDASLVSDGFGARALSALRAAGVSLFIDDIAYQDAVNRPGFVGGSNS